jgi:hypothetical protein
MMTSIPRLRANANVGYQFMNVFYRRNSHQGLNPKFGMIRQQNNFPGGIQHGPFDTCLGNVGVRQPKIKANPRSANKSF